MHAEEKHLNFEHKTMFPGGLFCKLFTLESPKQSRELAHSHNYYQIWYVVSGNCDHCIEGQTHTMKAGDGFILPLNLTHRTELGNNSKVLCCEFRIDEVLFDGANIGLQKIKEITNGLSFIMLFQQELHGAQVKFTFSSQTQRRIEGLMTCMLDEYQSKELLYEDFLRMQLLQLLLLFMREYAELPATPPSEELYCRYKSIVENTIGYIRQHFNEPLCLDDVCRRAAMSKTYFCYLFKLQTSKTFVEYLIGLRMEKAIELLATTERTITDISQDVGFQTSTHFTRTFHKLMDLTSRKYRLQSRK